MLATPRIVILDSSTLGKVSRDYWGPERSCRDEARCFLARLQDLGVFVTFTLTHISELLRHGNEQVVRDRLAFLRTIPLIAWLRPYDRSWFPGGPPDLLRRELHAVVHGSARNWREIVDNVRPQLWETGVGSEMFVEDDKFWSAIRSEAERQHKVETYVASVARTDPGQIMDMKLCDVVRLPKRPREDWDAYLRRFARVMQEQIEHHGDRRFDSSREAAVDFADKLLEDMKAIEEMGGDPVQRLLEFHDVPAGSVSPEMTIGEVGELAVWGRRLEILATRLRPPVTVSIRNVPQDTLPSHVLERRLASIQIKAERVSGSDLGDVHVAPLVFYADGIQLDRRIQEFLNQVRRDEPKLASLMGQSFRSSDYSQIPRLFDK